MILQNTLEHRECSGLSTAARHLQHEGQTLSARASERAGRASTKRAAVDSAGGGGGRREGEGECSLEASSRQKNKLVPGDRVPEAERVPEDRRLEAYLIAHRLQKLGSLHAHAQQVRAVWCHAGGRGAVPQRTCTAQASPCVCARRSGVLTTVVRGTCRPALLLSAGVGRAS